MNLKVEAMYLILVVVSVIWFATAAGYISNLRRRLRESKSTIQELAVRDGLTGVWNRRQIDVMLATQIHQCAATGEAFSIGMVDIDYFKRVNDVHGHPAGDQVLQAIAQCMKAGLRELDELGRYGGEEFLILFGDTDLAAATITAQRLRGQVAVLALPTGIAERVTVSIGVAQLHANELPGSFVARADQALYQAKRTGRNCVVCDGAAS